MSRNLHNHLVETYSFQEHDSTCIHLACDDLFQVHLRRPGSRLMPQHKHEQEEERINIEIDWHSEKKGIKKQSLVYAWKIRKL